MSQAWSIPGVTRKSTFAEAAGRSVLTSLSAVSSALDAARSPRDSIDPHVLQEALRRLRTTMSTYTKAFPEEAIKTLRKDTSDLFGPTSELRDIDIQLGRMRELRENAPEQAQPGIKHMIEDLTGRETGTMKAVESALDIFASANVLDRLADLVETATGISGVETASDTTDTDDAEAPDHHMEGTPADEFDETPDRADTTGAAADPGAMRLREMAGTILSDRLRSFERSLDSAVEAMRTPITTDRLNSATNEMLHQLRVGAKKLRYTSEIFAPIFGKTLERVAGDLGDLQDVLGEIHDADVVEANIVAALGDRPPTDPLVAGFVYVLGDGRARRALAQARLNKDWTPQRIADLQDKLASVAN